MVIRREGSITTQASTADAQIWNANRCCRTHGRGLDFGGMAHIEFSEDRGCHFTLNLPTAGCRQRRSKINDVEKLPPLPASLIIARRQGPPPGFFADATSGCCFAGTRRLHLDLSCLLSARPTVGVTKSVNLAAADSESKQNQGADDENHTNQEGKKL